MGIIMHKGIAYGGGGSSVTEGYYKVADGKFYEHFDGTTYSDEITGEDGILYLDLSTNNLYRWSTGAILFVLVGKSTLASLNDTNIATPADGQALEYNGTSSKWVNVAKKAADTPTFTEQTGTRSNIVGSGETMATILGKIKRWFSDLKDLAFIAKDGTSSTKYLQGDGTWQNFPTIPDDTKVTQTNTTGDASYRVLFSNNANDTTETDTARKNTGLQYNPSKRTLTTNTVKNDVSNHLLTGSGTTGQDKGSGQTNRYVPSVWTFNLRNAPADGDEVMIKIPAAGISYGVWLSVDNGTTYYPVGRNDTSRLQTQFANGTTIHLVFQTNANMSIYARGGADSSTTYTGNYWKVVNYYDSNTTYSVVSTSANGLAPKITSTTGFLKGDGTWATPTDSTKLPLAGGTMTGTLTSQNVIPNGTSYDLGGISNWFRRVYTKAVRLCNTNGYLGILSTNDALTADRTYTLPNETGTLATREYLDSSGPRSAKLSYTLKSSFTLASSWGSINIYKRFGIVTISIWGLMRSSTWSGDLLAFEISGAPTGEGVGVLVMNSAALPCRVTNGSVYIGNGGSYQVNSTLLGSIVYLST